MVPCWDSVALSSANRRLDIQLDIPCLDRLIFSLRIVRLSPFGRGSILYCLVNSATWKTVYLLFLFDVLSPTAFHVNPCKNCMKNMSILESCTQSFDYFTINKYYTGLRMILSKTYIYIYVYFNRDFQTYSFVKQY